MLCFTTVIAIYSKTGGKNGKHTAVTDASNISVVSYLAIQVFEHMHGCQFWEHPDATANFQTKQFTILSSYAFLSLLSSTPKTVPTGLELALKDAEQFRQLLLGESKFMNMMCLCHKCGQTWHFNEDEE
jgi:hypothetical protein